LKQVAKKNRKFKKDFNHPKDLLVAKMLALVANQNSLIQGQNIAKVAKIK
jgi:hypothetical protein